MLVSVITPVFNEVNNLDICADAVQRAFELLPMHIKYEHIFADNRSTDGTRERLINFNRSTVRVIMNHENYGGERSMLNAILRSHGDIVIAPIAADLQDHPAVLIPRFIEAWNAAKQEPDAIAAIRENRRAVDGYALSALKTLFYLSIMAVSRVRLTPYAGVFMITKDVVRRLAVYSESEPFLRIMIPMVAKRVDTISYQWRARERDFAKGNYPTLFRMAWRAHRLLLFGSKKVGPVAEDAHISFPWTSIRPRLDP